LGGEERMEIAPGFPYWILKIFGENEDTDVIGGKGYFDISTNKTVSAQTSSTTYTGVGKGVQIIVRAQDEGGTFTYLAPDTATVDAWDPATYISLPADGLNYIDVVDVFINVQWDKNTDTFTMSGGDISYTFKKQFTDIATDFGAVGSSVSVKEIVLAIWDSSSSQLIPLLVVNDQIDATSGLPVVITNGDWLTVQFSVSLG